jgi:hypothetical protein
MGAPVSGQTGLSAIVFLLERQQQKLGDQVGRELHLQQAGKGGDVVDILPNLVIGIGGHRLVKVAALHRLDRRNDLVPAEPKPGGVA